MSVRVLLPNAFQKHTNNVREISSTAANLPELVTEIEGRFPALRQHLRGEDGQIRRFINFYVNEEDIRFLGNEKYQLSGRRRSAGHPIDRRRMIQTPNGTN